jgi:hypothetical protein
MLAPTIILGWHTEEKETIKNSNLFSPKLCRIDFASRPTLSVQVKKHIKTLR